jgi:DNA-binding CsgD family transcriptional regulator
MWDRWRKGESLNALARLFDRNHSAIQGILARTDGIRPVQRRRSRLALTLTEREAISRGVVTGRSMHSIAAALGRAPSTVSRELRRNGGRRHYWASKAEQAAWERARRPKSCKLVGNPPNDLANVLRRSVEAAVGSGYSVGMGRMNHTINSIFFASASGSVPTTAEESPHSHWRSRRARHGQSLLLLGPHPPRYPRPHAVVRVCR